MDKSSSENNFFVSVFGGSLSKPGELPYVEALELGRLLGTSGTTVMTGGYIGIMEAVSRGASESGGRVIGITCDEIEAWRSVKPNPWVQEERRYPTLRERIYALIEDCDAAIALPGGVGTLAEVALLWSQIQVSAIQLRPLLLVGEGWRDVMNAFFISLGDFVPDKARELVILVPDVISAYSKLQSMRNSQ